MFLSASADAALQLETVGVIHQNLVLFDIGNIEQPVLRIDGHAAGSDQPFGDDVGGFVLGVEYKDVAQAGIGNKKAVVIVHGQTDDANEVGVSFVLDEFDFASFRIEDKDGADFWSAT